MNSVFFDSFVVKFLSIMAVKKKYLRRKPICRVTFEVSAGEAQQVSVVGDFNNWRPEGSVLQRIQGGLFRGVFELPRENAYEFRYLIDQNFVNEAEADRFQWNDFARSENSVLLT